MPLHSSRHPSGDACTAEPGPEIGDVVGEIKLCGKINGPAGMELGTGGKGIMRQFGTVDFDLGVIADDVSLNPLLTLTCHRLSRRVIGR